METILLLWNGYRYFPYERELAKREVEALFGTCPDEVEEGLRIPEDGLSLLALDRLTYFRHIVLPDGSKRTPDQARLEMSSKRKNSTLSEESSSLRQSTRYSAHGLHEYRGKFNPQVVRSIGNILRLQRGAWVLDPFCGSGTTLLECAHIGWNAIGIDLNPLGAAISNAKIKVLKTPSEELISIIELLRERLRSLDRFDYDKAWNDQEMKRIAGSKWTENLVNFNYLSSWFFPSVLAQFAAILCYINACTNESLAPIFRIILSDLVRKTSLQEPADLRVRRRKNPLLNYPVIPMFMEMMDNKLTVVLRAQKEIELPDAYQQAFISDSRLSFDWLYQSNTGLRGQKFDCAITSPPYATALPYIDTQRLSLCLLGLIESSEVSLLDRQMVGTRELLESKRKILESNILEGDGTKLPKSVLELCHNMLNLATLPGNGFRRRNMPALVFGYFSDMAEVLINVRSVLQPSGTFALIVGRNRTTLGGKAISIDTPTLLSDIGVHHGWKIRDIVELDAYHRFDMHQRNSIRTETLILLENP